MQSSNAISILYERGKGSFFLVLTLVALAVAPFCPPVLAQRQPGTVGMGLQVGQPSGLALKLYRETPVAYDGILTTDADDYVSLRLHRVWEHPLPSSPLYIYVGPGLFLRQERAPSALRTDLGLSAEAGLNFYAERFEVFLHVTPTLRFLPDPAAQWGQSVGLRYYLHRP